MATYSPRQLYDLARSVGLDHQDSIVAAAIALGESGGRTNAVGDTALQGPTWGPSIGLWQIRSLRRDAGTGRARDATKLTDPLFNARAMYQISSGGRSWTPWTVYTSGTYRRYLPAVQGAASGSSGGAAVGDTGLTLPGPWAPYGPLLPGPGLDPWDPGMPLQDGVQLPGALGDLTRNLVDPHLWRRVALVVGGLAGIIVGVIVLARPATSAVADVASVVPGAVGGAARGAQAVKAAASAMK